MTATTLSPRQGRLWAVAARASRKAHQRVRGGARRAGAAAGGATPTASGCREVTQLLSAPWFDEAVHEVAERLHVDAAAVRVESTGHLREMAAVHDGRTGAAWHGFCRWITRAYDVYLDRDQVARLRDLDREHSLAVMFSHRSYLDTALLTLAMSAQGISPAFGFGGANLNFFPLGTVASRNGTIFIRRDSSDAPVYRFALRSFIGQMVRNRANMMWSIEGGRTRTGKLRPPMFGILRYLVDACDAVDGPEVMLVPVSIVYDQLHEVPRMTAELRGGHKRPENLRWMLRLAREQGARLGRAHLDIGDPVPLRARLAELRVDDAASGQVVERVALDVSHRINRATPVTTTAVVSLALLGADRALTLDEVLATVQPLARYVAGRRWRVAGAADLTDRSTIRRTLAELVSTGVMHTFDGGPEQVWAIVAEQHLVAAFYRNTAIHILVDRAIAEVALLAAAQSSAHHRRAGLDAGLALRELLKFDFFFSGRDDFLAELASELDLMGAGDLGRITSADDAAALLHGLDLHLAHLVLRPFLDAYHVVADRLLAWGTAEFDEAGFLDGCLRLGRQWELQHRIVSAESVSLELFRSGLRLARHRGLLDGTDPLVTDRRAEFAREIRTTTGRLTAIAHTARTAAQR